MKEFSLNNLTIAIENKLLLSRLNIRFSAGQVWGILGPNGVGKTTLLHTLAGLRAPFNGEILLDNINLHSLNSKQRAQKIGLLFQDFEFSFPNSVLETALMGRFPHQKNWFGYSPQDIEIAKTALTAMNLIPLTHRSITSLSGGERRKVMLATLLAQDAEIYLLDEPTNHLDIQQQMQTLWYFTELAKQQNKIIIMVLHDLHLIRQFCDNIILLEHHDKMSMGPKDIILNTKSLQRIFSKDSLKNCVNYFE